MKVYLFGCNYYEIIRVFIPLFFRLWMRYDFHHTGTMDYKEFLTRYGVRILPSGSQVDKPPSESMYHFLEEDAITLVGV